ncbi:MAG: 4'-phosphopantetheinyl transferase superfamily protein [Planctomycetaceae bacterium]|nr:4'-phosphopantetheinyl transferase superfamily protein [Planctomycetaceae bacterium]
MSKIAITHRQVDLWRLSLEGIANPAVFDAYRPLLSPEEVEREQRFTNTDARTQFLAGRALLRTALSQYLDADPRHIRLRYQNGGKPTLDSSPGILPVSSDSQLQFNLSHTHGMVVCAITLRDPIGVDIESTSRRSNCLALARRFFAPAEANLLLSLPPDEQQAKFIETWTLKESFIKAIGAGLAMPLANFCFTLADDGAVTISFTQPTSEQADAWQFARLRVASDYQVAIAVRRPASEPSEIVIREMRV